MPARKPPPDDRERGSTDSTTDAPAPTWRRIVAWIAGVVGLLGVLGAFPYVGHAWTVITGGYRGPDSEMALGIGLVVVGPLLLLGLGLCAVASPRRWALVPNVTAVLLHAFFWITVTVEAPRPELGPYHAPQPAFVCGTTESPVWDPQPAWDVEVALDFAPPALRGEVRPPEGSPIELGPEDCRFESFGFICTLTDREETLEVAPTVQDGLGFRTGDDIEGTNSASAVFRGPGGDASYTDVLPYASACTEEAIAEAREEMEARHFRRLLLPMLYQRWFGEPS